MGLLNIFAKQSPTLMRLPAGSFTVDREGCVLTRTLPRTFPVELIDAVAAKVLTAFRGAASADLPLTALVINYPTLRITARELRGGAIVFFSPTSTDNPTSTMIDL
jgi:hypothetical protein